jgi:hypothetical protein
VIVVVAGLAAAIGPLIFAIGAVASIVPVVTGFALVSSYNTYCGGISGVARCVS